MSKPSRIFPLALVAIFLCALGFLFWTVSFRVRHVEFATDFGGGAETKAEQAAKAASAKGCAMGENHLIVPEHNNVSYHWINQTQQMFAQGEWRVRHIDYENTPFGHDVHAASPYRWWLGGVAWCEHKMTGLPLDRSVERAALYADPLLHFLAIAVTALFAAWCFGLAPAALVGIGMATVYPFASEFLPGMPEVRGLVMICILWSVMPLLAGLSALKTTPTSVRRWFFAAGVAGGLGMWIDVTAEIPIVLGIALGGLLAAWVSRGKSEDAVGVLDVPHWRAWALGGALTSLGTYLLEYAPSYLGSWQLKANHPLYGIAWLGLGELLALAVTCIQRKKTSWSWKDAVMAVLALAAVAAMPLVAWKTKSLGFLVSDLASVRLTRLPEGPVASSLWAWMVRDGITPELWAAALPLILVFPALWLVFRRNTGLALRSSLAIAMGPVLLAAGFACRNLGWWSGVGGVVIALALVIAVALERTISSLLVRWIGLGCVALVLLFGALQIMPPFGSEATGTVTESEMKSLIERDLAHWLAKRLGDKPGLALAPPNQSATLFFYGGLRGFGTLGWDNQDGLMVAVRILSATTPQESKELIDKRGVTHIIIPSWDSSLDSYALGGAGQLDDTFLSRLHYWKLPPWLKPVPYELPTISGFEGQWVRVLEVVEEQDDATALSVTAEYFIEMGQPKVAAEVAKALRRFPADLGAWVARAEVETALVDETGLASSLKVILPKLKSGADRNLAWDRRVGLAVVLARAKNIEQAKLQVKRCLDDMNEQRLRSLPTGALFRLLILGKAYGMQIADKKLQDLAVDLLPAESRARFVR